MRNLSLSATTSTNLPNGNLSATAIDVEESVLYVTSECQNPDADVEINIWKIALSEPFDQAQLVTQFPIIPSTKQPQVVSLHLLADSRNLIVISSGGDITAIPLDYEIPEAEIQGTVEPGILAAGWSPDDSLLALVTAEEKLILMTATFDVLSEAPIHTSDFGEDAPINVGWGSKQTQFHGSIGKVAAQASKIAVGFSPDDDNVPRVSWRGDGAYFVVSALSPSSQNNMQYRVLRVYDRNAALQSTAEAIPGLEHSLSWRPSGNLIASSQRFGFEGGGAGQSDRHDIVFFERNGLRHGEFGLRVKDLGTSHLDEQSARKWGYKVRELSWSSDSNILGVWIEHDEGDVVQLWTTGNYHWYLKQEVSAPAESQSSPGRFTSMSWHPEKPLCLILTTPTKVYQRTYIWETYRSHSKPPNDSGSVAVVDGSVIRLTPFRTQNVPPPMCSHQLSLAQGKGRVFLHVPVHASFAIASDMLAILWGDQADLWDLRTRLGPGLDAVMNPVQVWSEAYIQQDFEQPRQILLQTIGDSKFQLAILGTGHHQIDTLAYMRVEGKVINERWVISLPHPNGRLVSSDRKIVWQARNGELYEVDLQQRSTKMVAQFPEFCYQSEQLDAVPSEEGRFMVIGLTESGKLHVTQAHSTSGLLAPNVTSFTLASGYVIFTTSSHQAKFVPYSALASLISPEAHEGSDTEWESRRIERGSRIVVAVPSLMNLVLQMPRGNLETISPRPLIMETVRKDLDAGNYRKAFLACRKHRIDLSVLVGHNQATFFDHIPSFVDQVHEVDHINLFLTHLSRCSMSPKTVADLCDAVRVALEAKDLKKYVNSILTAYVVKSPPDHESALALLPRLRDSDLQLVEDAIQYVIFLVDADRLFDTALGMYDFPLVLMIAQHAQKDPREYLPFLRELRALEPQYQRFKIDDHLKRYEKAIRNLSLAGDKRFDEALEYVERHQLYEVALSIWRHTAHYNTALGLYGEWLFERREFRQAAAVFVEAGLLPKAMIAYEKSLDWRELFDIAGRTKLEKEQVVSMAYRVAEDLASKKRPLEAAQVLVDYAQDIPQTVSILVQGNQFAEAKRITTVHNQAHLVADIIHPGALDSRTQITEEIHEMREQLQKQLKRIRELRVKKSEEPESFYGAENTNLANVDVMTDVSMAPTAFTRYTVAPSAGSRASKRSSKSKRRAERKVGSGRKGTVDEEEYLLKSVTKLTVRFQSTQRDAQALLPFLLQFSAEHRKEGQELQGDLSTFENELSEAIDEIWQKPLTTNDQSDIAGPDASETNRPGDPLDQVPKPERGSCDWRIKLFDLESKWASS